MFGRARREIEEFRAKGDQSLWIRDELLELAAILEDREAVERGAEALLKATAKDRWRFPQTHEAVAPAYLHLGDFDRAIRHIEQAISMPAQQRLTRAYLRLDALWHPLRNDGRFQKLANEP